MREDGGAIEIVGNVSINFTGKEMAGNYGCLGVDRVYSSKTTNGHIRRTRQTSGFGPLPNVLKHLVNARNFCRHQSSPPFDIRHNRLVTSAGCGSWLVKPRALAFRGELPEVHNRLTSVVNSKPKVGGILFRILYSYPGESRRPKYYRSYVGGSQIISANHRYLCLGAIRHKMFDRL
jgi:hypothetical protein